MKRLSPDLERELMDVAGELADVAGKVTLPHFRSPSLSAENKETDGWDPVTAADREAEAAMRDVLRRRRPDDGILGEEFEAVAGTSGLQWVLDPIDGTRSFVSGAPVWGTLISVADADGPLFGVIDQPYMRERLMGGFGFAGMVGPAGRRALSTRHAGELSSAILFTTFPEIGTEGERAAFERLSKKMLLTRYGLDCYGYALLAMGCIDLVVEAGLEPYDCQAPIAVVSAAGGIATDWSGNPAHRGGRLIAAASAEMHRAALDALDWSGD